MKVVENERAIPFETTDAFGNEVSLSTRKGKKVFLSFLRYTGCPVCNFRVHELIKRKQEIEQANVEVILVFESSNEHIRKYIDHQDIPFKVIGDAELSLYKKYGVEASWAKFFKSLFTKKLFIESVKGIKLFKKASSLKGTLNRIGAVFIY